MQHLCEDFRRQDRAIAFECLKEFGSPRDLLIDAKQYAFVPIKYIKFERLWRFVGTEGIAGCDQHTARNDDAQRLSDRGRKVAHMVQGCVNEHIVEAGRAKGQGMSEATNPAQAWEALRTDLG